MSWLWWDSSPPFSPFKGGLFIYHDRCSARCKHRIAFSWIALILTYSDWTGETICAAMECQPLPQSWLKIIDSGSCPPRHPTESHWKPKAFLLWLQGWAVNPRYLIAQTGQPLLGKLEFSHAECHAKVVHLERVWNPALERQAGWKPSPDLFGYPDCPGSKTHFSWWCFMLRFFLFTFSFGVTWNLGYNQNHLLVMMPVMHKLNTFFHTIWRGRFANSISNTGSPKNRWVWD